MSTTRQNAGIDRRLFIGAGSTPQLSAELLRLRAGIPHPR
jgi:hypothetical protein